MRFTDDTTDKRLAGGLFVTFMPSMAKAAAKQAGGEAILVYTIVEMSYQTEYCMSRNALSRHHILRLAAVVFLMLIGVGAWGQSAIPAEPANYLQVTGLNGNGDEDDYMVVFFEVPDTITSTLYFAIDHPGLTDSALPDAGTAGATWNFHLVGGSGALSSSVSRQITFANLGEATTGTVLQTRGFIAETGWHYFNGVSPSQGEHIGNKYYFKVVAEAPADDGAKNAFRLDCSYSGTGNPTGVADIDAFAYAWTLGLQDNLVTWDLYPFVPDSATGDITRHFWDFDDNENGTLYNFSNAITMAASVATGLTGANGVEQTSSYLVTGQTNGTWRLRITETAGGTNPNTSVVWFTGTAPAETYRTYSAYYAPPAPYRVTISPASQSVLTGTAASFALQIVDASGNPVPYSRAVGVTSSSATALINGVDNDETITTGGDGLASFTVTNSASETVTIALFTDGTHGSINFGAGTDGSASLTTTADPAPTLSSASNLSYLSNQGAPINLPAITIADSGAANISAANDIRIRHGASLVAPFLASVTTPSLVVSGVGAGAVNGTVTYPGGVLLIDVTTGFAATNILTIGAVTPLQIDPAADAPSSGRLEMSVDGGSTWTIVDDKYITVVDFNPTFTWDGSAGTDWTAGANWAGGAAPSANDGTENIVIPNGCANYPVLPATDWSINQLTIDTSASLTVAANNLTITGTFSNTGILIVSGAGRPSKNDTDSGTVRYTDAGGLVSDFGATDYWNLEVLGTGTSTLAGATLVANAFTVANGTLAQGGFALTAPSLALGDGDAASITNNAALGIAGQVTINVGAAASVTLGSAGNDFSTIAVTSANNVTITDIDDIILAASSVSGTLAVTSGGALTQDRKSVV